ncbi:arabinogalactan endo-1,4-beta-galactosidase [Drepanopeziza brunnea f. sp. 'multigermtubi' MB_m1]|uniref:Arabinogalactan endo-beta-1,4-galactanase n=1 Tax=Marssonina brunnea f. sp. multigermtubi (strain MB_m1) TaxID=1072389 RepID=K1WTE2_MARBU|nr:arabinogalactan endo-1,4-beta-galactosidase [Drepanopeziza brunnea f. sp. 'multigermtubi' MB_m1]EKD15687.1 arabinogalactan endo-1,4-beta-galactosidase [Drepanopeziza brunnea f. sp. 'multigermtubi' MB_m1]
MLAIFLLTILVAGARAALKFKGVDWSSLLVEEAAGYTYKTKGGKTEPLENILVASGVNTVRQRIWVNPSDGNYNLDYNLKLARRAQAAGLEIYLDLHFSDKWADPLNQEIPSGWPTSIEDLSWRLYNYTQDVSNAFAEAGISPSIISIGNEITAGLLFPTGSISSFYNIATLLHSASSGIKYSNLATQPQIMIHLDNGWNWETQKWWYTSVLDAGPLASGDFDVMGVSYYPFYGESATLAALKKSLHNMASTWGKSIMVVETNWPFACPSPKFPFPPDVDAIPRSVAGQKTWMKDVAAIVAGVSGGSGIFYWEPAWIRNGGLGSSCWDNLLVEQTGEVRSSLGVFAKI